MQDLHATDPDPVRRILWALYDAFAPALGETDPACRAVHLATLARLVAEAEVANAALLPPAATVETGPDPAAGALERALRRMQQS